MSAAHHPVSSAAQRAFIVGGVMTAMSIGAFVAVFVLLAATVMHRPPAAILLITWCAVALVIAAVNTLRSIEMAWRRDWHPFRQIALLSVLIALTYPGMWL